MRICETTDGRAANHPKVVPEGGLATIAQATAIIRTLEAMNGAPAPSTLATIPSALTVGRGCVQPAAVATGAGSVAVPAPKVAPAPTLKISTEVIVKLGRAVLGSLPKAPAGEQRELVLRCLWQAHLDGVLPPSLKAEMQDFESRFWRPDPPTGNERALAGARKDSIRKTITKLGLN